MALMDMFGNGKNRFSTNDSSAVNSIRNLNPSCFYVVSNGKIVQDFERFVGENSERDVPFFVNFRLRGGKGGFGSLLRSFRVNKSTNQLMCRDLNGRRLASIDDERKLRQWIERAAEREREKEAKKKLRYEKLKAGDPKHQFEDPTYFEQREQIIENTEEAFEEGFEAFSRARAAARKAATAAAEAEESSDDEDLESFMTSRGGLKRKFKKASSPPKKLEKAAVTRKKSIGEDSDGSSSGSDEDPELLKDMVDYFKAHKSETSASSEKGTDNFARDLETMEKIVEDPVTIPEDETDSKDSALNEKDSNAKKQDWEDIRLADFDSIEQLEALGLDHLKHACIKRGLKCGGSLVERSERLWSVKGIGRKKWPPHVMATANNTASKKSEEKK